MADFQFLRTIPEDQSDVGSSLAPPESTASTVGRHSLPDSIRAQIGRDNDNRSGSVISDKARMGPLEEEAETTNNRRGHLPRYASGNTNQAEPSDHGNQQSSSRLQRLRRRKRRHGPCQDLWTGEKRKRTAVALGSLLLLMVAAIVIIVVFLVDNNDNGATPVSTPRADTVPTPSPVPTPVPTTPTIPKATFRPTIDPQVSQALDQYLIRLVPPSTLFATDPNDPQQRPISVQGRARDWILHQDLLRDDVLAQDPVRIYQRFALVTFLMATNAEHMLEPAMDECLWVGMDCERPVGGSIDGSDSGGTLRRILLSNQNLTGTLVPELQALQSLGELELSNNNLVGTIPRAWFDLDVKEVVVSRRFGMVGLYWLNLANNDLRGEVPGRLWSMPIMRFLYLSRNGFTGRIEKEEQDGDPVLSPLEDVRFDHNLITGPFPKWAWHIQPLTAWIANDNLLTGPLPEMRDASSRLLATSNLRVLDLSYNNMTGPLPADLFNSAAAKRSLQFLYLDNNQIAGTLPTGRTKAEAFVDVWLHSNDLQRSIPTNFALDWPNLSELTLHDNARLTGTLGPILSSDCNTTWASLERLTAPCNFSGPVVCICCTECA